MGRKSQSKQNSKKSNVKENKLNLQKRKELIALVEKLLQLTSTFQTTLNTTKNWEQHEKIDKILKEINYIEAPLNVKNECKDDKNTRHLNTETFIKWLLENGAQFEGVEIDVFKGYDLGLKAIKNFSEGSLVLTVPRKIMMSEQDARNSHLGNFITADPLLKNMPNITLALFLLLEKSNPESFWKPYLDILPDKYSTVLYFTPDDLSELKPSPTFDSSLKLYRSIARQYAYFYNKIQSFDMPSLKNLRDFFTFDNYRWAVSTVMTRQNNLQLSSTDTTAFIPLWDMCNHEHGKITTDFNKELNRGECYALRDFQPGEQIFIFYGARSNADLFLHNGFVYPKNQHDSYSLCLGVSSDDPLKNAKLNLLNKLGLGNVTYYHLYRGENPVSAELLAFIRIFNMTVEELTKWSNQGLPGDLVSSDTVSCEVVGAGVDRRAYTYLLTRCNLLRAAYDRHRVENEPDTLHRKNIHLLKECEIQILDGAIKYLKENLQKLPTVVEQ